MTPVGRNSGVVQAAAGLGISTTLVTAKHTTKAIYRRIRLSAAGNKAT